LNSYVAPDMPVIAFQVADATPAGGCLSGTGCNTAGGQLSVQYQYQVAGSPAGSWQALTPVTPGGNEYQLPIAYQTLGAELAATAGIQTIKVMVTDLAGNSTTATYQFQMVAYSPPVLVANCSSTLTMPLFGPDLAALYGGASHVVGRAGFVYRLGLPPGSLAAADPLVVTDAGAAVSSSILAVGEREIDGDMCFSATFSACPSGSYCSNSSGACPAPNYATGAGIYACTAPSGTGVFAPAHTRALSSAITSASPGTLATGYDTVATVGGKPVVVFNPMASLLMQPTDPSVSLVYAQVSMAGVPFLINGQPYTWPTTSAGLPAVYCGSAATPQWSTFGTATGFFFLANYLQSGYDYYGVDFYDSRDCAGTPCQLAYPVFFVPYIYQFQVQPSSLQLSFSHPGIPTMAVPAVVDAGCLPGMAYTVTSTW